MARKLEIRPAEILQFLSLNGIVIDDNTNSRLEEEHVIVLLKHFNPDILHEVIVPEPIKNQPEDLPLQPHLSTGITESEEQPQEDQPVEIPQGQSDSEVIKAPKVELSGLKILGKIDLPEAKKKQDTSEPQAESINIDPLPEKPVYKVKPVDRKLQRPDHRPRKNPIAQQREREMLEEKKKREEQASREKERKTRNYYSKVKMSPPTKAVRMVDEPVMQMSAHELEEVPRTWLGRFIKWLTKA